MKRVIALLPLTVFLLACGNSSPVDPTPPPAATRIMRVGGNLNFGDVPINTVRTDGLLTISNDGTGTLTFTGLMGPCASAGFSASPTTGSVAPGTTTTVGVRFAPTSVVNCTGTITVVGDQTAGTNTIAVTARGTL